MGSKKMSIKLPNFNQNYSTFNFPTILFSNYMLVPTWNFQVGQRGEIQNCFMVFYLQKPFVLISVIFFDTLVLLKGGSVIFRWIGLFGNWDLKKFAKTIPTIAWLVDNQLINWYYILDMLSPLFIRL